MPIPSVDAINIYTKTYVTSVNHQLGRIYLSQEEQRTRWKNSGQKQIPVKLLFEHSTVNVIKISISTGMILVISDLVPTNIQLAATI